MIKKTPRIRLALASLICVGVLTAASCTRNPAYPGVAGWTLQNDQRARLSDYKGKVVVLDFYATWCEPCREETPHLVQLQRQFQQQGLQVIGLNVGGADDRAEIPAYASEFGIEYPLGLPDDEIVEKYLGDNGNIPQVFVFDREGHLVKRFVGYNGTVEQELERIVQAYLTSNQG